MSPARIPRIVYPETGSHIAAIKPCLAPGTSVIARLQGLLMMSMHLQPSNGSANKQLRLRHSQKKTPRPPKDITAQSERLPAHPAVQPVIGAPRIIESGRGSPEILQPTIIVDRFKK